VTWRILKGHYRERWMNAVLAENQNLQFENQRLRSALETLANWSVPLVDPDPANPQTEYGQMKKFARNALSMLNQEA
jgi:regulator of replication initiation timing